MKRFVLILLFALLSVSTVDAQDINDLEISFTFPDFHFSLNRTPGLTVTSGFKGSFRAKDNEYGFVLGGSYGYSEAQDEELDLYVNKTNLYTGLVLVAHKNQLNDYWFTVEPIIGYSQKIIYYKKYGKGKSSVPLFGTLVSARWKHFYVSGGIIFTPPKNFKNRKFIEATNLRSEPKYSVMIGFGFNI